LGIRPAYRELRDTRDGPVTGVDPAARESSSVGFRLPTAPEWETACRAECATIRPFSNEPGVFNRCAQYLLSTERPAPVGTAWPDDNGLFDMLGNALELVNSEMPGDDTPATWDPATVPVRTVSLRGGNWVNREYFIRPAMVTGAALVSPVIVGAGFRLARTETIR
jgi:formylglycine-generating enzyme required for sulfatase activity